MIVLVSNIQDEADIVECWARHHLAEGVDLILTTDQRSTDGTRDILTALAEETGQLKWVDDPAEIHYQPQRMTEMAEWAAREGADWIVPADADEFWLAQDGHGLARALNASTLQKVYAPVYHHVTWEYRHEEPKLPKVAFRWKAAARLEMGNHEVLGVEGERDIHTLEVRELQYRGFDHFCDKIAARSRTLDPVYTAQGHGSHITSLAGLSTAEMAGAWNRLLDSQSWVWDPIPTRTTVRPKDYVHHGD